MDDLLYRSVDETVRKVEDPSNILVGETDGADIKLETLSYGRVDKSVAKREDISVDGIVVVSLLFLVTTGVVDPADLSGILDDWSKLFDAVILGCAVLLCELYWSVIRPLV